jgi:ribosomal protein S13
MNNDDNYHLALGRFVDAFATAEHNLKFALAATAGISHEVAQALFAGARVDVAIGQIRQLYEAQGIMIEQEVDKALSQMKVILTVRNAIMHYGAVFDGSHFTTSTAAHTLPKQAKTSRYELNDLERMTFDLLAIGHRFIWMAVHTLPNAYPEAIKLLDDAARTAMQFKPPQPNSKGNGI